MLIHDQLAQAVGSERGMAAADRLCEALVGLLQVDAAAISLIFDGANSGTLGASGPDARTYDELQFTFGEGPCLDSVSLCVPVLVSDLADVADQRWPAYTPAMLERRVCSVFAMPVMLAGVGVGALDLYRDRPSSLSVDQMAGALAAAELAQMPLLDLLAADLHAAVEEPGGDMWAELRVLSRSEISQATGMLVAQLDLEPTEALVLLRAHAYAANCSATEVARDVLAHRLYLGADE